MSGHSPGEWFTDPEWGNQAVFGPDGFMIADCGIVGLEKGAPTNERCTANARLISAAPNMLAAIKGVLSPHGGVYATIPVIDALRAALAKAEGTS